MGFWDWLMDFLNPAEKRRKEEMALRKEELAVERDKAFVQEHELQVREQELVAQKFGSNGFPGMAVSGTDRVDKGFQEIAAALNNLAKSTKKGETQEGKEQEKGDKEIANAEKKEGAEEEKGDKDIANAEKDEGKSFSKALEKTKEIGKGVGSYASGVVDKAKNNSVLSLVGILIVALACYYLKLTAKTTTVAFMADFFMLMLCYGRFGRESVYVFLISFFAPVIAYGIVSGEGVSLWVIVIIFAVVACFSPQMRGFFSKNGKMFLMEIVFISLVVTAVVIKDLHIGGMLFTGLAVDKQSVMGNILDLFANQFLNLTWIFYIGVLKNPGEKIITGLIKLAILAIFAGFLLGTPLAAAGMNVPGINSPLVTEEGKQQFITMLGQGSALFNGVPIIDRLYGATAGLFSVITNVPTLAQNFSNTMAPATPANDVTIAGLDLVPSPYAEKTFGPDNPDAYVHAAIKETQKIQDAIKFTNANYKIDNKKRITCGLNPQEFYLYYPEGTDFMCSVGKACPYDANAEGSKCPCPTAQAAPPWCLTIGSHSIETRAMYEMTTTSSYTPIFVDRVKKIAAEAGGQSVLAQCGLQEYAMPVARYMPSNSPASLGIVLSQDKMPVVVGEGLKDAPTEAPLWLIVSLKKVHNGFVSKVSETEPATETDIIKGDKLGVIVKLPTGLTLITGPLCDFDANGVGKGKTIYNAESGDVISWSCKLNKIDPSVLLGNALCTPVTITATATYEFTIRMTSSVQVVPPEAEN